MNPGRVARLRGDDSGFSLAELAVTMLLLGIVTSLTLAVVVQTTRTVNQESTRLDSLGIASMGVNELTQTVRAATEIQVQDAPNLPAFVAVGPESMTLYVNLGPVPSKVTYSINGSRELVEQTTRANVGSGPYWTFPAASTIKTVARKIPAGTATPLFTYYDGTGAIVARNGSTNNAVLSSIESVSISLTVQANGIAGVPVVTLSNKVGLPNLSAVKR